MRAPEVTAAMSSNGSQDPVDHAELKKKLKKKLKKSLGRKPTKDEVSAALSKKLSKLTSSSRGAAEGNGESEKKKKKSKKADKKGEKRKRTVRENGTLHMFLLCRFAIHIEHTHTHTRAQTRHPCNFNPMLKGLAGKLEHGARSSSCFICNYTSSYAHSQKTKAYTFKRRC